MTIYLQSSGRVWATFRDDTAPTHNIKTTRIHKVQICRYDNRIKVTRYRPYKSSKYNKNLNVIKCTCIPYLATPSSRKRMVHALMRQAKKGLGLS